MLLLRAGLALDWKGCGLVLRPRHEEQRIARAKQIADRIENGVPLDDGDGPLRHLGPYDLPENLDRLEVRFRVLSMRQVREHEALMGEVADKKDDSPAKRAENGEAAAKLRRALLLDLIADLRHPDGIEGPDGPFVVQDGRLTEEQAQLLDDNGLAIWLYVAGSYLQNLPGEARKNCGASQLQTSPAAGSTATPALSSDGTFRAATAGA